MKNFLTICVFTSIFLVACTNGDTASTRPPRGNPNAVVLVEEYADLQCPACRAAHGKISIPIVQKYSSQIRFEYKHFPLRSIHRFALDAAEMSECAADQGKFWEFVDFNYEHQVWMQILLSVVGSLIANVELFLQITKKVEKEK
jgi:hypothetical protein